MTRKRDYRKEYDTYHGTPEQRENNNARKRARYHLEKKGVVKKGDGKEVDHKDGNPRNNSRSNLQVLSRRENRKKGG
jgi:HNH endonuclease